MSGSRKSRGRGGRGGGRTGGNGGGYGGAGQAQGGGAPQNPVEFYLYASEQFPMEQCPAQVKPAAVDGAIRLAMPIREHLGDIIAWFSAMAPADPTARLVVCQATKSDKAWLQAFVKEGFSSQLQYGDEVDKHGNKLLQFSLLTAGSAAAVPPPPATAAAQQPAAAAGSEQPVAAAAASAKDAVAHAAQHTKEAIAEAGHKAGEAAAAAVGKAKETAAAAVAKAQEAGKAASSSLAAAAQQANGAAQGAAEGEGSNQAALTGKSGPNTQLMAVGGIALAVTTIVLGVLLGGKRKSRA